MKNTNRNMMYTFWSGAILLCLALVAVVLVFTNAVGNTGSPKAEATPAVTETPTPMPQANPIAPIQSSAALAQTEDKGSTYVDQIYFLGDKSLKVLQSETMLTGKDAAKQVWVPDTGSLPASLLDTAKYKSPATGHASNYQYEDITNELIQKVNGWIAAAAESSSVKYLDMASGLVGDDGFLPQTYQDGDGMHLNAEGMKAWMTYLRTHAYP